MGPEEVTKEVPRGSRRGFNERSRWGPEEVSKKGPDWVQKRFQRRVHSRLG